MAGVTDWRVTDRRHAATGAAAFTGDGAKVAGGRFNSVGVVYTSGSLALAMLEVLVQANGRDRLRNHVYVPATFDEGAVEAATAAELPPGWDDVPDTAAAVAFGDAWLRSRRSLVLRVPSVVVPVEHNYLLNPEHPDFGNVLIGDPTPAPFDRRLLDRLNA